MLGVEVKSYSEKYLAERAVEKIRTVKGVANELEVELTSIYKRDGAEIVKSALNALKWTFLVPRDRIKIVVEKGRLTLSSDVEYNYQKERAEEAVEGLYGVTSITNNIKIIPNLSIRPSLSEVKEKIIKEFERNARIDANNIQVKVDGSKIILKGSVKNFDEERKAKSAAWATPGVSSVIDELKISW